MNVKCPIVCVRAIRFPTVMQLSVVCLRLLVFIVCCCVFICFERLVVRVLGVVVDPTLSELNCSESLAGLTSNAP